PVPTGVPVAAPTAPAAPPGAPGRPEAAGPAAPAPAEGGRAEGSRPAPGLDRAHRRDWPHYIGGLEGFPARSPHHAEATAKLYAARVDYGLELKNRDRPVACEQWWRALALDPDRPEARAELRAACPEGPHTRFQ